LSTKRPATALCCIWSRVRRTNYDPSSPDEYSIASFTDTEIPILVDQGARGRQSATTPPYLNLTQLWQRIHQPRDRQPALVELNYRLALPVAAIVLALVGIPLGISTRKGGKSVGLMLSILLVFVYYILMAFGRSFAMQGRVSPSSGSGWPTSCLPLPES
jgi:lipopolysaccharide export LptBFGC system permease protein LptF